MLRGRPRERSHDEMKAWELAWGYDEMLMDLGQERSHDETMARVWA